MDLRLFFLDDDEIQNDIMDEYVQLCELPTTSVFYTDGFEALKYLESRAKDELPHVLFIDVFMPLIDGWEVLNKLGQMIEASSWSPSIYMLTSSVSNKDRAIAAEQKHLKQYLNKPMKLSVLKPILEDEYRSILPDGQ